MTILASLGAQEKPKTAPSARVPRLVRYSGTFRPSDGQPIQPIESATLSVYRDETGGDSLWHEIQNVTVDSEGHYAVVLGSTLNDGMPMDLFSAGEPRWLGVRFNRPGEAEQTRVPLVSVPYALKAGDAETLGGKPASAYLLAPGATAAGSTTASPNFARAVQPQPRANSGVTNYIGMFANTTDLTSSVMYQSGSFIGVNTTSPIDFMHVTFTNPGGTQTGYAVQNLSSSATAYSGMLFYDQNGNLGQFQGFNNSTHEYRINNIAPSGTINFMINSVSKFQVRNDGDINIAGQIRQGGTLFLHSIGTGDTAVGIGALANNGSGFSNTAVGASALNANTFGNNNVAVGYVADGVSPSGASNTAVGSQAMAANQTGSSNVAIGAQALQQTTVGNGNVAIGAGALSSNVNGSNNTVIGMNAGAATSGSNNIVIANNGVTAENATTRIGSAQTRTFIAGIRGATTGNNDAISVVIDSNGQLGTVSSSRRFKEDIQDMGSASRSLLKLRPVTFRYIKPYADGSKPLQYGLIAEEVAEVFPELVARSADGQIETVKYQMLDGLLLNEVQRQQREFDALTTEVAEQQKAFQSRLAELERLVATIAAAQQR
jgi:hypothetical protein